MNKHLLIGVGLVVIVALAGAARGGHQQPQVDLEARVAALEAELQRAAARALELEERAERLERYVASLARSSESLAAALQAAEEAGFTAGINPRSRELLLAGWRAHLATQRAGLPKPPEPVRPGSR